ncbi:hypothetical protein PC129_g18957 [Phytophthora cactorum]|nr:hypothetical protein Pcac1_g28704 [Phytophthora cactorum]KAG2801595.1 hypothetical protein PC112_g19974 [Phytophthora cactorum]KAG2804777.1 hypothetical protein PC111_g18109 [Phytophthora cactorum]KAG2836900.1 hypothetical protein PC113_g19938 [Phytophthora cactorum]KAG2880608.1 hypothetical protein PC114_g21991 [Phytophthora cactorum]
MPNLALMTGLIALVRSVDSDRATVAFRAGRIIDAKAASVDAVICKEPRTEDMEGSAVAKYAENSEETEGASCA